MCLLVISWIVRATSSNLQDSSDNKFLNNVIEDKPVAQLDTNTGMDLLA